MQDRAHASGPRQDRLGGLPLIDFLQHRLKERQPTVKMRRRQIGQGGVYRDRVAVVASRGPEHARPEGAHALQVRRPFGRRYMGLEDGPEHRVGAYLFVEAEVLVEDADGALAQEILSETLRKTWTDAKGRFKMLGIAPGNYGLVANPAEFSFQKKPGAKLPQRASTSLRIRPGTECSDGAKIGNFVETKKANIGAGSKVSHLSYIGDTEMGADVNIGAGTITCNYDGANKHVTVIEDGVFVGSDTQLVAPVRVGRNATIGAGSTITRDVPAEELTVTRAKQTTIRGWKRPQK